MTTDLARHIQETPLADTHEHLRREPEWLHDGPDILQDLFDNYVSADLRTAGASPAAMQRLLDASDPDIAGRFRGIEAAWQATRFTGYGEAVRLIAEHLYGLEELSGAALAAAAARTAELRQPGERYRLLHDVANLDQVQTDDMRWPCLPDHSGLDFFLYDLSWFLLCRGDVEPRPLYDETGVEVSDLASLRRAMETIFERHAPCAIAVKSQHAYARTLQWSERSDGEAAAALDAVLRLPSEQVDRATWLCLGDWCWARGVELAIEHRLLRGQRPDADAVDRRRQHVRVVRLRRRHRLAQRRARLRDPGAARNLLRAGGGDRRRCPTRAPSNGNSHPHHAGQSIRLLRRGRHPSQHPRRGVANVSHFDTMPACPSVY